MPNDDGDITSLKSFLNLGLLDIAEVAKANEEMTVAQYFEEVEKFVLESPRLVIIINHMRIIRNDAFFLNELSCYNNIVAEIDEFFLGLLEDYKNVTKNIGARGLMYLFEDLEGQFAKDINKRNTLLMKICGDINNIHNKIKRIYSPRYGKNAISAIIQPNDSPEENKPLTLLQALNKLETEERTRKLQIALVDDMPVVLNTMMGILNKHYEVFAFTKGEQLLKYLKNNLPDLFILDIEMPDMNGYALFKAIKDLEVHKNTPIILMTSQAKNDYIETAIDIGVSDFIVKPLDEHILLKKVWNNVERKKYL